MAHRAKGSDDNGGTGTRAPETYQPLRECGILVHIGSARRGRGADVARAVSALVLLDDDCSSIEGAKPSPSGNSFSPTCGRIPVWPTGEEVGILKGHVAKDHGHVAGGCFCCISGNVTDEVITEDK